MSALQFAGFLVCVALASSLQNITGFALALILLGLTGLFELAPLPDVANVATVLSLANAAIQLRGTHKSLRWSAWRHTVSGSVFGVAAGVALLAWLSANVVMVLRLLLGVVVIACAIVVLVRTLPRATQSSGISFGGYGFLSGLLGGLFSASGPPLVYHFYRQPWDLDSLRDTLVASLAFGSLLRLALVIPTGQFSPRALWLSAVTVPLVMTITWWMRRHPPAWRRETVLKVVCGLLLVTGAGLIGPAVAALLR
ncbi:TSUP family transporter [Ramlibacter alkalitolerans]|uniref:Probable membrane transporter protein n=1 Tax=Ramlibacter alkalitolerans TaxID=2039631 RepID=A0ABS1JKS9_9BURK|nr:TSUP family transporter [Ramlibacter alkalitolerans]MBL0424809.1 TSUP family transporter [Ramlibacter alkalitolerans]